jgi:hypothetical protein
MFVYVFALLTSLSSWNIPITVIPDYPTIITVEQAPVSDKDRLRKLITQVLRDMEPAVKFSDDAVEILMMIAAHESHLGTYSRQRQGPARGVFQIEPATEKDIHKNYLRYHEERRDLLKAYTTDTSDLEFNLAYQIVIARLHLTRNPGKLPSTPLQMAIYLKKYWNTFLGEATYSEYLEDYNYLAL